MCVCVRRWGREVNPQRALAVDWAAEGRGGASSADPSLCLQPESPADSRAPSLP